MKHLPKIILGISLILILALIIFLQIRKPSEDNTFKLNLKQNSFRLDFNVNKVDQAQFEQFLDNLSIPTDTEKGINLNFDASTSARLAFLTPAKGDFQLKAKQFKFSTLFDRKFQLANFEVKQIKIPKSTALSIFAPDLSRFVTERLAPTSEEKVIIQNNIGASQGHYLLIFPDGQFVLIYHNELNPQGLTEISTEASAQAQTKDQNNPKIYALKKDINPNSNLVFFETNNYQALASSSQVVKDIMGEENLKDTFPKPDSQKASIIISFAASAGTSLSDQFYNFLLPPGSISEINKSRLKQSFEKIETVNLLLKDSIISGLISLK